VFPIAKKFIVWTWIEPTRQLPYPIDTPVCELPTVTGNMFVSERNVAVKQAGLGAEYRQAVAPGVYTWTTWYDVNPTVLSYSSQHRPALSRNTPTDPP
jgi:hypothetical protein